MGDWSVVPDAQPAGGSEWAIMPSPGQMQQAPAEEPGIGESLARGAFQGVTFGFGDELSGLVRSLVNGTGYQEERDAARKANASASEANPIAYGGAELAGGLAAPIPGLGALKVGGKIATAAAHGAIAGGLGGLGGSEADLTKGDFHQAASDTISNALLGGAIGAVTGKAGQLLEGAGARSEEQAIKALAGGESKTSGAAWQKTKRMVNNPETKNILHEQVNVEGKTTSLERVAGKSPDAIADVVDAQTARINDEIRPIYAKSDQKNGGVSLRDYIGHLDEQIKATETLPPSEARVYRSAIDELKQNAMEQWGQRNPDLHPALGSEQARQSPEVRDAIMKQFDVRIPSEDVRAEATALQKIGFKTVDPLNPGLQTQVKRDMGNMVRDFVNEHVMKTLGGEDHSRLLTLNKRMNAWLGVGTVAAARAEKEAAGRVSLTGAGHKLLGHGSLLGAGISLAHGNIPAAAASYLLPKAVEHAPAAIRTATRAAAGVDARLKSVAEAAAGGNPFAQSLLARIRGMPGGVARLAALERTQGGAPAPQPVPDQQPEMAIPPVLAQQ